MVAAVAVIIRFTFRQRILLLFMVSLPPFNPLRSGSCRASNLDARKKPKSGRLHRGGSAVQRGRARSIERGIPCVRRLTASSVTEIHGSFALECAFEVPWLSPSDRRQPTEGTCDVRAPNISGKLALQAANSFGGAFYKDSSSSNSNVCGDWAGAIAMLFDASRSNSTYSKSSTVQPASVRFLPCIKI